jgi:peroxiredoxin family protein
MEIIADREEGVHPSWVQTLEQRVLGLEKRIADLEQRAPEDRVSLVVFSGDLDRVLGAFVIATGAAAMSQQVSMFFTFWGLSVLKKNTQFSGKTFFQKMMAVMSPGSSQSLPVSRMNACEMSRDVMGITDAELVGGLEYGGAACFLADSLKSRTSLFI